MAAANSKWVRTTAVAGVGALVTIMAGSLLAPAHAETKAAAAPCPSPVPIADVQTGMKGEGLTVVTGSTPQPFDVEVLGVMTDGIGAGKDMILIKVSDQPGRHVIDQGGGIWGGMSGSPVYVNGQLLGAVSYGFSLAPSPIGGLTAAADMLDLLDLPDGAPIEADALKTKTKTKVPVSKALRANLASKARVAAPRGALQQLPSPLSVSGVGSKRLDRLQSDADKAGWSVKAYAGGRSKANAPQGTPVPGGNFAAALSYGDVTAAAIGTTTAVCGDRALAFGHPLNYAGPVSYGANDADSLTIVKDDTFGSFKMANIGADFGTVDQDRLAGLRADLGASPTSAQVTTVIRNSDTNKTRTGSTRVVDQVSLPGLLPYALWTNYDATFDEWNDGRTTSNWTISGTRDGGLPFAVSRSNQWASKYDPTVDSAFELAYAADALVNNEYEEVKIDSVSYDGVASTNFKQLAITKVEVRVGSTGKFSSPKSITVKTGAKLQVRVTLRPYKSTKTSTTTINLTVPKSARGQSGQLDIAGGQTLAELGEEEDFSCLFEGEGCSEEDGSLDATIKSITAPARNDAVVVRAIFEGEESDETKVAATAKKQQKYVVTGEKSLRLNVKR